MLLVVDVDVDQTPEFVYTIFVANYFKVLGVPIFVTFSLNCNTDNFSLLLKVPEIAIICSTDVLY